MNEEADDEPKDSPTRADEKLRLECAKLEAEIAVTRRPFFKTHGFYTGLAPVLLALLGLIFTWYSGWFDVQRTRVNNEKLLVEAQTERLQQERVNLEFETKKQRDHIDTLEKDAQRLRSDVANLTNQVSLLIREKDEMRSLKDAEARRLANSDSNAMLAFDELDTLQKERRSMLLQIGQAETNAQKLRDETVNDKIVLRHVANRLGEILQKPSMRGTAMWEDLFPVVLEVSPRLVELQTDELYSNLFPRLKSYEEYMIRAATNNASAK